MKILREHKVLVDFISNRFDDGDLAGLTPENWSTLIYEAGRHRITPLLYHKIKQAGSGDLIPKDVIRQLREKYLANAYRNTILFHQLSELVGSLNNNEIPVILLKGAHLAEFVYKGIALRPMSDLDILIKEEHLSKAVQIAFDAGYQFFGDGNAPKKKANANYDYGIMPHSKHFKALVHPATKSVLEIHCSITSEASPFEIPAPELWQMAKPVNFNENTVFLLSPEDLIIHLCLHAAYDDLFGFGLGALYDISITIRHYAIDINWHEIQRRSSQWRTNQCLLLTLYLTKKWLGATIPEEIFKDFSIDQMADIAEKRIFKISLPQPVHPHYIQWLRQRGLREKIYYIGKVLFPSRDFMANRYLKPKNSKVLFSTYLFRIFQAFELICAIASNTLQDSNYDSRIKRGDNDLSLKEWLSGA